MTTSIVRGGLNWAASILGTGLTAVTPLTGGLTSTMLALTDDKGRRTARSRRLEVWGSTPTVT